MRYQISYSAGKTARYGTWAIPDARCTVDVLAALSRPLMKDRKSLASEVSLARFSALSTSSCGRSRFFSMVKISLSVRSRVSGPPDCLTRARKPN